MNQIEKLQNIADKLQLLVDKTTEFSNWEYLPDNSLEITYYGTVNANNPSGNKNISNIKYLKNSSVVLTQYFAYDADDDVVKVSTIAI